MNAFSKAVLSFAAMAMLAACGGGSAGSTVVANSQQQGIAVGEPNPTSHPLAADFIKVAAGQYCAGTRNNLYVIDDKMVFADSADLHCADASYSQVLYGAKPDNVICSAADSIAGPQVKCSDASQRSLFDTMRSNTDKADLGLGGSHKVQKIYGLVSFETIDKSQASGIAKDQNVVIRDDASWSALWAVHGKGSAVPAVDFSKNMVIGVFMGTAAVGCYSVEIGAITQSGSTITVNRKDYGPPIGMLCTDIVVTPAHLVVVAKSDAEVVFSSTKAELPR